MSATDDLEALRRNVARHSGPARTRPLLELGRALTYRCWHAGLGSPAARPYLDEAITALDEALGYLNPGDFVHARMAGQLGLLLSQRHIADSSSDHNRERGITLLDEALAFPQLPRMLQIPGRWALAWLLLSRLARALQSPDFPMRALGVGFSEEMKDSERAVECLRQVVDDPDAGPGMTKAARSSLALAEAIHSLISGFGGGPTGLLAHFANIGPTLQKFQDLSAVGPHGVGFGYLPNPFDFEADRITRAEPLERPVFTFEGPTPAATGTPPSRPGPLPPIPAGTFRAALFEKLEIRDLTAVHAVLDRRAREVDTLDDLAALGSALVEAPGAVGTDHLLFGAALYLRADVDRSGGWSAGDGGPTDARAAAECLFAAAPARGGGAPHAMVLAVRLASRLDELRPDLGAVTRLEEQFEVLTEALRRIGADALVYQVHGTMLMLSTATGRFEFHPAGSPLPNRLLVIGQNPVPTASIVSFVSSGAQVIELSRRARRPLTDSAVFVANPRRHRQQATIDAMVLRRTFYPRSAGLGDTAENVDGVGTADDVRARLDASLLHLGCGITAGGGLELAGQDVLYPTEIAADPRAAAGGLAVLPPVTCGAATLTEALLASRFLGVITFIHDVPDRVASLIYFLLHRNLVDDGLDPASAVAAVCQWLADPHREPPGDLPSWYQDAATTIDPAFSRALIHHGL